MLSQKVGFEWFWWSVHLIDRQSEHLHQTHGGRSQWDTGETHEQNQNQNQGQFNGQENEGTANTKDICSTSGEEEEKEILETSF